MEKSEEILNSQNKLTRELFELPHILNVRLPGNDELMYENRPIRERMEEVLQNAPLSEETKLWLKDGVITYIESLTIQDDFSDNVQRREFEKTFENKKEISNSFRNNRLGRNNINDVIRFFNNFESFEKKFSFSLPVKKMLDEVYLIVSFKRRDESDPKSEDLRAYEEMGIEDKLEVTRKVAELAREICVNIIQKFSQTSL